MQAREGNFCFAEVGERIECGSYVLLAAEQLPDPRAQLRDVLPQLISIHIHQLFRILYTLL